MNSAEVLIKFKGDTDDVEKKTESLSGKIQGLTKSIALGNIAAKGITKAFQVMSENMDGAISRFDTLNNFPKVMSNLGISAEDSKKVIEDLGDKLTGLPTSLDSAAMAVQRLTSKNGDVKKSEELYLALNNAILAGGAGTDIQTTAMEQLSQAYAKGKPDMMEWRSMMTAMPAQLKQVATAMGYVDAEALGEAIRSKEGAAEFSRMMETMVKMNKEGVNGFKSFDEQARNATGGIQTSVANMKTAIIRGITSMITKVNESLEPFGGLSGVISSIGKLGEKAFKKIGEVLSVVIPKLISLGQWIVKNQEWLKMIIVPIATFVAVFKTIATVISIINGLKVAFVVLKAAIAAAGGPITLIIAGIAALVVGIVYLWNHCESFRNLVTGLWEGLKNGFMVVVNVIKGLIVGLWEGIKTNFNLIIGFYKGFIQGIKDGVSNFINTIKTWVSNFISTIVGFIAGFISRISQIPGEILNFFTSLPGKMLEIGTNIVKGIWNGISNSLQWIKNKITGWVGNVMKFIKGLFGIHSPSKVMEEQVGQWLPKGIAVGITANTDSVNNAMDDLQSDILTNYGVSPQVANSSALHYSPNIVNNNIINVETDPLGQVVNNIKTFSGGAKNDYNWGAAL